MRTSDPVNSNQDSNITGSSENDEPVYLTIGQLGKSHGLHGEILLYLTTDFPERIRKGKIVFIGKAYTPYKIESVRRHNNGLILKFENIESVEDLMIFNKALVFIKTASLPPLPEGEYYHHQLLGISVVSEDGKEIGKLSEILVTGANDVYVVKDSDGKEELIPAIKQNLIKIDIKNKIMVVKLLNYFNQE